MNFFIATLHENPDIAIYLTLALGAWFGTFKIRKFSLGVVTSTLIAGLLIGQLGLHISPVMQATFFDMFLFAVGYAVGPEFIRALKSDGLPQVIFTVIICLSGLGTALILGKIFHYDTALTAGLLSGGYTNSTVLGVASSVMSQNAAAAAALLPVAYAVTYPFGTAGSAWFLATLGPKLMGINLPEACRDYEITHNHHQEIKDSAYSAHVARALTIENPDFDQKTVAQAEEMLGHKVFIRRIRYQPQSPVIQCEAETVLTCGAEIIASGSLQDIVASQSLIGPESADINLLNFATEKLDIVLSKQAARGKTLGDLLYNEFSRPGHGIFLLSVTRADETLPPDIDLALKAGDVLTVKGAGKDVAELAAKTGYADRNTNSSDIMFMCAGIAIGCLIGAITIRVGGIPLSLGTNVGAIVAGVICGYIRSVKRTFGKIANPAIWLLNNLGLNGFIAIVGINAASGFIGGLKHYGLPLFICGIIVTLVPLILGLILGRYVFRFHPGILFGVCAGARSTTAALGAIQDAAKSSVPAIGYTVGYAVSRLVMAVLTIVLLNIY